MRASRQNGRRRLYLDFDGYFAAVEEQAAPALHGRPVAVLPYPEARICVISANAAAKRHGVGTGTGVDEARWRCPGVAPWSANGRTSTCGCSTGSPVR